MRDLTNDDAQELQCRFIQEHENWSVSQGFFGKFRAVRLPPPASDKDGMLAMLAGPGEKIRWEDFSSHGDAYNYTVQQSLLLALVQMGVKRGEG
jgi:hypothetical protein